MPTAVREQIFKLASINLCGCPSRSPCSPSSLPRPHLTHHQRNPGMLQKRVGPHFPDCPRLACLPCTGCFQLRGGASGHHAGIIPSLW